MTEAAPHLEISPDALAASWGCSRTVALEVLADEAMHQEIDEIIQREIDRRCRHCGTVSDSPACCREALNYGLI